MEPNQESPRELQKKVTDLRSCSEGVPSNFSRGNCIKCLAYSGYLCWSGITKCENTQRPVDGVDPDLNIAAS